MNLKKLFIALIAVLSLSTVVGCNNSGEDKIIYHEDGVTTIDSVVGKNTKTSHTSQ